MAIKCGECGDLFMIAKYCPSTCWYGAGPTNVALDKWFEKHGHDNRSMFGPTHFSLEFESLEDDNERSK
jgi:hypothetical protein